NTICPSRLLWRKICKNFPSNFKTYSQDWQIVFAKQFESKKEACEMERTAKEWKSRAAIQKLIEQGA
ncbi:MAG: hypothetical protein ACK4Q5_13210, partial [Saprospiraceae bacterium]